MSINLLTFACMSLLAAIATFTACAGDDPPADVRDKFTGNYKMTQTCDGQPNPDYEVIITKSSQSENEIFINNLGGYGQNVKGTVQGDKITIPSQEIGAGMIGNVTMSGEGTLASSDNSLDIALEVLVPAPGGGKKKSTCQIDGRKI